MERVTPFEQFLIGHVIGDLLEQVAGLARERVWKDEIVDTVDAKIGVSLPRPSLFVTSGFSAAVMIPFRGRQNLKQVRTRGGVRYDQY
jgi:hypothetical protein